MASVHIARFVDMDFMFNISAGVGRNRPNQRLDVMLIQYLLNMATNEQVTGPGTTNFAPIRPPDLIAGLPTTGNCGPDTMRCIAFYQAFRNQNATRSDRNQMDISFKVKEDGAIDPWKFPVPMDFAATGSPGALGSSFTLAALCYDAAKNRDVSSGNFSQMPQELVKILCAR